LGRRAARAQRLDVDVSDQRKNDGIAALERTPHPPARDTLTGGGEV